ncbi:MAG: transcriptional repressor [Opitutales bacterium]|nr:transcriptional repressor [Opitutales bacterium]
MTQKEICDHIHRHGLRVSKQRVAIYQYMTNPFHPSAEMIYEALRDKVSSLSLATVYNCLHDFVKAGLAKELRIENEMVRYDADISAHGHFKCKSCSRVFDIPVDVQKIRECLSEKNREIEHISLVAYGICEDCLANGSRGNA